MSPPTLTVLLDIELPSSVLAKIHDISSSIKLVAEHELKARPEWLDEAEVLFTERIAPERLAAAPRLRWVQTFGAGVEWLLTPALRARDDLLLTNTSGIHARPVAEHVFGM